MTRRRQQQLTALLSSAVYVALLAFHIMHRLTLDERISVFDITPARSSAISMYMTQTQTTGTLAIAVMGGLWAFVWGRKDSRIEIGNCWSFVLLGVAELCLVTSVAFALDGQRFVLKRLFYDNTIDLGSRLVDYCYSAQFCFFIFGLLEVVLISLVCRPKERWEP